MGVRIPPPAPSDSFRQTNRDPTQGARLVLQPHALRDHRQRRGRNLRGRADPQGRRGRGDRDDRRREIHALQPRLAPPLPQGCAPRAARLRARPGVAHQEPHRSAPGDAGHRGQLRGQDRGHRSGRRDHVRQAAHRNGRAPEPAPSPRRGRRAVSLQLPVLRRDEGDGRAHARVKGRCRHGWILHRL